jgi:hypothetical protein
LVRGEPQRAPPGRLPASAIPDRAAAPGREGPVADGDLEGARASSEHCRNNSGDCRCGPPRADQADWPGLKAQFLRALAAPAMTARPRAERLRSPPSLRRYIGDTEASGEHPPTMGMRDLTRRPSADPAPTPWVRLPGRADPRPPRPAPRVLAPARIAPRRPPAALDPRRVPGLELANSQAGRTRARPCHLRAIPHGRSRFLTVHHGHSGHVALRRFSIGKGRHEW